MKLINGDKYKKDIEHYRNTICYQRNVTMDDCIRILDKQEDVLDKIRAEISDFEEEVFQRPNTDYSDYAAVRHCLEIIDNFRNEVSK